jgi:dynein heavy chain, axonemal
MCVSLAPDSSVEQLLILWRHECDWLYGHRMIDNVDNERYKLAYNTVVKCNFNEPSELAILARTPIYFSNLKETESGLVIAGLNGAASGDASTNGDEDSGIDASQTINAEAGGNSSGAGGVSKSESTAISNSSNFLTDGYAPCYSSASMRTLIQTAINEYNKENQRIEIPLYDATLMLICRLCHALQCSNCCIIAAGGVSPFLMPLVATLIQFNLISFKSSQFMCGKEILFEQLRHKLVSSYCRAGIKVSTQEPCLCLCDVI